MPEPISGATKLDLYLKLLDYKRSIGMTQWTVFSIFAAVSQATLVFAVSERESVANVVLPALAVAAYWLGFLLFRRYRRYNSVVSGYMAEMEADLDIDLQRRLDARIHAKGIGTQTILLCGGLGYTAVAVIMAVVRG